MWLPTTLRAFRAQDTAFDDDRPLGNGGNWHDSSTWGNGVLTAADDVVVPAGKVVQFDGATHEAKSLLIQGATIAVESGATNKSLRTGWIFVDGGSLNIWQRSEPLRYTHIHHHSRK